MKIGSKSIELSNKDKILFPHDKITKGELISYYHHIAPYMLPHMKDRPLSQVRHPDGINREGFFQKNIADYYPRWIKRVSIKKEDGHNVSPVCNNVATLVYLANQACITPHLWLSKTDKLYCPDRIIFDLDPSDEKSFALVKKTALRLKKIIEDLGLIPFVMTTGSRGLHVVIPIKRTHTFDTVRTFAHHLADFLVLQDPEHLTTQIRKQKRQDRLFIDCGRNAYAQTSVAPYAIRPKRGAPVATPLRWKELKNSKLKTQSFTIKNIIQRVKRLGDPWQDINRAAHPLGGAQKKLQRLMTIT